MTSTNKGSRRNLGGLQPIKQQSIRASDVNSQHRASSGSAKSRPAGAPRSNSPESRARFSGNLSNAAPLAGACLASVLIGCTGAFQVFTPSGGGAVLVYLPLLFACWLIFVQLISPMKFPREPWSEAIPLMLLCIGPMLSIFWSSSPQKTMTDSVTLLVLGLLAIAASKYLSFDDRLKITGNTLAALLLLSLLVVFFAPSYGVDVDSRAVAWRGIFSNKNSLGRVAAIELLISAFLVTQAKGGRKAVWAGACLTSLFVLVNTDSQTALLAALVGLAVVVITRLRPWLRHRAVPVATALVGGYFMLSALIPVVGPLIATYVSRDPTLTGRTVLWALSGEFANQKPLLGWGFGAVWQIDGGIGQTISRSLTFLPGSAHNGLIDLRLQLGILGVALFAVGLWVLLVQALDSITSSSRNSWRLGYVVLLLTMDLTESTFYFGFTWFLAWIFLSGDRNKTWRLT